MKRNSLIFIFISFWSTLFGQDATSLTTINQFLDGYAWTAVRSESNPNANLDYKIYYKNSIYTFKTKNGEGKIIVKAPTEGWKYYFLPRALWVPDSTGLGRVQPISRDSLYNDVPMLFESDGDFVRSLEAFIVEAAEEDFTDGKFNLGGNDILLFNKNIQNSFYIINGFNPTPTNQIQFSRVISPPKLVQDFIVGMKKAVLQPIKFSKTFIFSTPDRPTQMYLIKGDKVEVLGRKRDWVRIRYYGKRTIEGWIKRQSLGM